MTAHAPAQRHEITNSMLGFILFLASEVMFFGGLFAAYFIARGDAPSWPPEDLLTAEQVAAGVKLELHAALPAVATVLLVLSSVTIQWGEFQIKKGNQVGLVWGLFISLALGLIFLAMQMYDYAELHFGVGDTIFGTTFYTLTGFHGAHVAGGAIFMFMVLMRALAGQFTAQSHEAVTACSMYWHFVDVVWIALFTILYIVPA